MRINIKATGIELTSAISDYVNKKISYLEKYLTSDVVAQVEVGKTTEHHKAGNVFKAEVHVIGGGLDLYAVSVKEDLYAAIDTVKDEIIHTLMHTKTRRETLARRGAQAIKKMIRGINIFKRRP